MERDSRWFDAVAARVASDVKASWRHRLCPPIKIDIIFAKYSVSDPAANFSSVLKYEGMSFDNCTKAIDAYPDRHYHLILIEGAVRYSNLPHSINNVRSDGLLVLDNSERAHYSAIHQYVDNMEAWERIEYSGSAPYNRFFLDTIIWKRGKV